jgi:hypothetical protein
MVRVFSNIQSWNTPNGPNSVKKTLLPLGCESEVRDAVTKLSAVVKLRGQNRLVICLGITGTWLHWAKQPQQPQPHCVLKFVCVGFQREFTTHPQRSPSSTSARSATGCSYTHTYTHTHTALLDHAPPEHLSHKPPPIVCRFRCALSLSS